MSEFSWKLSTPLSEILRAKDRQLEVVRDTDTVRSTLAKLKSTGVISLPVVGPDNAFEGMVDVVDIAGFALACWRNVRFRIDPKGSEFLDKLVYDVLGFSEVSKVVGKNRIISSTATLADALHLFNFPLSRHFTHTHRLAVLDNGAHLSNILSQSDLARFAWDNVEMLPNKDVLISELQLLRPPVVVEINTPLHEALGLLYSNRIGGIGLVDNEWRLVGCFSASDLRGVGENLFDFFDSSVLNFMSRATDSTLKPPVTVPLNAKLRDMLEAVVRAGVHRVFVVDNNGRPRSVATLTDLLAHLELD